MRKTDKSPKGKKVGKAKRNSPAAAAVVAAQKNTFPEKNIPAETLKKTITFFYLLSYCPPAKLDPFLRATAPMRERIAEAAGMAPAEYFNRAIPEVCRRIVAFHQATREPDEKTLRRWRTFWGRQTKIPKA